MIDRLHLKIAGILNISFTYYNMAVRQGSYNINVDPSLDKARKPLNKVNKLKPEDLAKVAEFMATDLNAMFIKKYREWNFSVGDVLIQMQSDSDKKLQVSNVSDKCPVPKKFQVIHIDELGFPWVRQISVSGGLGVAMYCLANYNVHLNKFVVDPRQTEAILLGHRYDPRLEYRHFRDRNPKYGRHGDVETK